MNLAALFIAAGEQIDLIDLEHEFVAIAELLDLAALGHRLDFIRRFLEFGGDFLERVKHLGHGNKSPACKTLWRSKDGSVSANRPQPLRQPMNILRYRRSPVPATSIRRRIECYRAKTAI